MNAQTQTKAASETIHSAMAAAFTEIEGATKASVNPHFKSKYADLGSVIDAIKPALINHGLFFTQRSHPSEDGVIVETVLHHVSGEEMGLGKLYVPAKKDAQGFGSALTYARRYALMTAFGVPAEDDDGHAARQTPANDEPAPRTKLDGPHSSKTALRAEVVKIIGLVRGATSLEGIDDILRKAKPTIKQAERDWPALLNGDPNIEEDVGLKGAVAIRREELADDGTLKVMIESMKQCDTLKSLTNWMATNESAIEALDDPERRKFELARELHESGIMAVNQVTAGA